MNDPVFRPGDRARLLRVLGWLLYPTGFALVAATAWGISRLL